LVEKVKKKPFLPRIASVRGGRGSGTIMELWKWRDPRIVGGVIPEPAFRLVEGSHARTRTIESHRLTRGASSGLWYPRPPRIALHCSQRIAVSPQGQYNDKAISAGGGVERNN